MSLPPRSVPGPPLAIYLGSNLGEDISNNSTVNFLSPSFTFRP